MPESNSWRSMQPHCQNPQPPQCLNSDSRQQLQVFLRCTGPKAYDGEGEVGVAAAAPHQQQRQHQQLLPPLSIWHMAMAFGL